MPKTFRFLVLAVVLAAGEIAAASPAGAVVCARGVYRAGCAGPRGAVVARRPVYRRPVGVVRVRRY